MAAVTRKPYTTNEKKTARCMKKGRAHKPTRLHIESKVENILHEYTRKPPPSEMTLYPAMVPMVRLRAGCKGVKVQQRTGTVYKPQIKGTSAGMNIQLNTLLILENEKEINESLLVTAAASLSWGTRWPSFIFTHEDLWLSVSALSLQVYLSVIMLSKLNQTTIKQLCSVLIKSNQPPSALS